MITLEEVVKLVHAGYRCPDPQCAGHQRPERQCEDRYAGAAGLLASIRPLSVKDPFKLLQLEGITRLAMLVP